MRLLAITVGVLVLAAASQAQALGASHCSDMSNDATVTGPGPPRFENRLPGNNCLPGGTKVTRNGKAMCSYPTTSVQQHVHARDNCYRDLPLWQPSPDKTSLSHPHGLCQTSTTTTRVVFTGNNVGLTDVSVTSLSPALTVKEATQSQLGCVWPNCRALDLTVAKGPVFGGLTVRFALPSPGRSRDVVFTGKMNANCSMTCSPLRRLCNGRTLDAFCSELGKDCDGNSVCPTGQYFCSSRGNCIANDQACSGQCKPVPSQCRSTRCDDPNSPCVEYDGLNAACSCRPRAP